MSAVPAAGGSTAPLRWLLLASQVPASGAGGGIVRYTVSLARALARRDDVVLHVVAGADARDFFVDDLGLAPAQVHPVADDVLRASLEQRLGHFGAPLESFDVVHGTKHLLPRRPADALGTWLLTVHDLLIFERPGDYGIAKRALLPREYHASLRAADAVVTVSAAVADVVASRFPELASRTTPVPLAPSPALLGAAPVPVPGLVPGSFALVVGDASPRKNLRHVLQLWPAVRARVPDAVLASVGPRGWGVDAGLDELGRLAAAGAAVRLEALSDGELRWAYEHAAVVLCPSVREGFGLPAAEARAFGVPVVSSPDPALVEAAGGDAVVRALDDPLGWVEAIATAWGARTVATGPARTWDDVAAGTVAAARAASARRGRP